MIIIGDVHGCYKTLKALVKQLPPEEKIIMVGDLIDRGPDSKKTVQWVIDNSDRVRSVRGNHENMFMNAYNNPRFGTMSMFLQNGGTTTFNSYKNEEQRENKYDYSFDIFPEEHIDFFKSMHLYIEEDGLFVSHSSYCANIPWEKLIKGEGGDYSLMWSRSLPCKLPDDKFHVFGHSIQDSPIVTKHYANIDTGAFYTWGKMEGNGRLTAIQYPSMKIYLQETLDIVNC